MADTAPDREIVLTSGDLRLRVASLGASLRGLWREAPGGRAEPVIAGYTGAAGKVGGQGDVLIPFPGRVRAGRYAFGDKIHQMPINDKDGPNAIHGFLRTQVWDIDEESGDTVRFSTRLAPDAHPGYPFALAASVAYELRADGMACRFAVTNVGAGPAPVAAGFHPYFTVGSDRIDTDELLVPMDGTLEFVDLLPTGRILPVEGTPLDFRAARPVSATIFNTCYVGPQRDADGKARVRLFAGDTGRALSVWMDEAFDYVVLYSGDPLPDSHRRRALAIEPMTCGSDAFNHPEFGRADLAPNATLSGAWGVELSVA
jgi:aldose 1-epimerase